MKLPCAVVRDLLPLYAEKLTEDETRTLIDEHLRECAECRQRLSGSDPEAAAPVDTSRPLAALKKEIRKRRRFTAIVAALLVFVCVYTWFYHESKMEPVPWQDGLIEVEGIQTRPYSDVFEGEAPSDPQITAVDVLVLKYDGIINGIRESMFRDEDGTVTELLEGWSSRRGRHDLTGSGSEMVLYPVPDRLLYVAGDRQRLLWGEPMNGGAEVLPRLALGFYILAAAALALVTGIAWFFLRRRRSGRILRQIFFAPVSWLAAHFLIKGAETQTFFMERDFLSILLIAAALYVLFTLAWQLLLRRGKTV